MTHTIFPNELKLAWVYSTKIIDDAKVMDTPAFYTFSKFLRDHFELQV